MLKKLTNHWWGNLLALFTFYWGIILAPDSDLKSVYNSATEESALYELDKLETKWGKKYPLVIRSWRENWPNLSVFFRYPEEIKKIIYMTNSVEALHRQFRKVTKSKTQFSVMFEEE